MSRQENTTYFNERKKLWAWWCDLNGAVFFYKNAGKLSLNWVETQIRYIIKNLRHNYRGSIFHPNSTFRNLFGVFSHEVSCRVPFFVHAGCLPSSKLWHPRFYTSNKLLDLNRARVLAGNGIHNNLGIPFNNNLLKA